MNFHRIIRTATIATALSSTLVGPTADAAEPMTLADRLAEPGPQGEALARRAGIWDATLTTWDRPGAAPVITTGLVAERRMLGPMLEEILRAEPGTTGPITTRVDDLVFNRLEGRWEYMSMDSRVPYGLMTAQSLDPDPPQRVFVSFQPFATTGADPGISGRMFRMEQVIAVQDADHDTKDQYFTPAGDTPAKWLAKRYSYTRRP